MTALRAEVDTLQESLARTSAPSTEADTDDPDWAIHELRRTLLQEHLSAQIAELTVLTERAGFPEAKNLASQAAEDIPIVADLNNTAVQPPPPPASSPTLELTADTESQTREAPQETEEQVETLELEAVAPPPLPTSGSGAVANLLSSVESTESVVETAVPDPPAMVAWAAAEPLNAGEVDRESSVEVLQTESAGPLPGPPWTEVGVAEASLESVASLSASAERTESTHTAHKPRRGVMAVLMRGALLTLVLICAFLVVTRAAPSEQVLETVAPLAVRALMAPPGDADERASDSAASIVRFLPAAAAELEPSDVREIEAEPDGVVELEGDSELDVSTEPSGDSAPSTRVTATIRAPGFTGVNLRRAPAASAATIGVLALGTRVELLGDQVRGDGLGWQQVHVPDGDTGWVTAGTIQR